MDPREIYTPELGDKICAELASGRSLLSISKDEGMPCTVTVYKWLRTQPDFANNYTRAREDQADTLADEIVGIADDGTNDHYKNDDGIELVNHDVIARSRLRVEARKWVAAKLKPKKYGDKVTQEVTGAEGGPVQAKVTVELVRPGS